MKWLALDGEDRAAINMKTHRFIKRWLTAFILIVAVAGLFAVGLQRLRFEADILSSLPQEDPVLADARYILAHHPLYERIAVDLVQPDGNLDLLGKGAGLIEKRMQESGLFREVGFQQSGQLVPELMLHIASHLPILFSPEELDQKIAPLLAPEGIHKALQEHLSSLQDLGGIGGMKLISEDPLALRNLVLSRLSSLAPSKGARVHNGLLLSADGKHVLIVAEPSTSGTDTRSAAHIAALMARVSSELKTNYGNASFTMTPVGAYRAALDNESSAKRNVKRALLFSTLGIVCLLIVGFPRPLIGLMALLPAFAGTALAIFVYSLFRSSISLMSVGFGGAIISFTVDYGLAYLLFLDRPYETRGLQATKEVWSLGLLAMLTTAFSFAFLSLSGFSILLEIGVFSALGVIFTYLFVHGVFPLVFPVMPPAKRPPWVPMQSFIDRLSAASDTWKVYAALALGLLMLIFSEPVFHVDLNEMNAVSPETRRADKLMQDVWGNVSKNVYVMIEGRDREDFQRKCDRIAELLALETKSGRILQSFTASSIFPGDAVATTRIDAWRAFWNPGRIENFRKYLQAAARAAGFSNDAFEPFLKQITVGSLRRPEMPEKYAALLGIKIRPDGSMTQVVSLTPGPSYNGADFYRHLAAPGTARVFDPTLFSERLGSLLQATFLKMAAIVGIATILTAFFYFLDWRLTLLAMAPTLFAIVCTLGTLNLLGTPLGIPTLMVSVVVIGMGTDYGLYLIRAYQRYVREDHPSLGLIRLSVFLSFATTFLGFAVLAFSDNPVLKDAGLGLAFGIGYSFLGAVMIIPPLMKKLLSESPSWSEAEPVLPGSQEHFHRALERYHTMETYPRLFARFKIMLDPMFPRLAGFLRDPRVVIDIGTGYGVPATWLLALYPGARLFGIDPNSERVRTASRAIGNRGAVKVGAAPDLPELPEKADTALILDMIHMLSDDALRLTLQRLGTELTKDATLIIRAMVPSTPAISGGIPWRRWMETARIKLCRGHVFYRTEQQLRNTLSSSGFHVISTEYSAPGRKEIWVLARLQCTEPQAGSEISGEGG